MPEDKWDELSEGRKPLLDGRQTALLILLVLFLIAVSIFNRYLGLLLGLFFFISVRRILKIGPRRLRGPRMLGRHGEEEE